MANKEPVENIDNVYLVNYEQDENGEVTQHLEMYYTDCDYETPARVFTTPEEAEARRNEEILTKSFPIDIVQFYMFIYTEDPETGNLQQSLTQVIPGNIIDSETQNTRRSVTRKELKDLYNKVDYIRISNAPNPIGWYSVSNKEVREAVAMIKQFYGLTNFPEKTGDFVFSKTVGRWLATNDLKNIQILDVVDLNEKTIENIDKPKNKLGAFFEGVGNFVADFFSGFNLTKWNDFIGKIFSSDGIFTMDINDLLDGNFNLSDIFGDNHISNFDFLSNIGFADANISKQPIAAFFKGLGRKLQENRAVYFDLSNWDSFIGNVFSDTTISNLNSQSISDLERGSISLDALVSGIPLGDPDENIINNWLKFSGIYYEAFVQGLGKKFNAFYINNFDSENWNSFIYNLFGKGSFDKLRGFSISDLSAGAFEFKNAVTGININQTDTNFLSWLGLSNLVTQVSNLNTQLQTALNEASTAMSQVRSYISKNDTLYSYLTNNTSLFWQGLREKLAEIFGWSWSSSNS